MNDTHKIKNPLARKIISKIYYRIHRVDRTFLLHQLPKNSVGAEVGVFKGEFTKEILRIIKPQTLYLIDLWEYQREIHDDFAERPDMQKNYDQVKNKFGKKKNVVIMKGYSDEELNKLSDESLDWIYIDADHRYEGVKKDLEMALRKIKKNGMITGDDYVEKYPGVIKAVDEIIKEKNLTIISIKNAQFILKKISN